MANKLDFEIIEGDEKDVSISRIRTYFGKFDKKVRKVNFHKEGKGVILFQKDYELSDSLAGGGIIKIGSAMLQLIPPQLSPSNKEEPVVKKVAEKFFNPYHFVNVPNDTPDCDFICHDRFKHNSGTITAELEFRTPGFIPDPQSTQYLICGNSMVAEDDEDILTKTIHSTLKNFHQNSGRDLPMEILFDPDCRGWNEATPEKHLRVQEDSDADSLDAGKKDWHKGQLIKDENGTGDYYIITKDQLKLSHKKMKFFQVYGKPVILGSSIRGMLRSTVEMLSNACFPEYDRQANDPGYMFHRLDVSKSKNVQTEVSNLEPVVIVKRTGGLHYIEVQQAKLLSPHIFNRLGDSGEKALGAYENTNGEEYFQKISVVGKKEVGKETGLNAYRVKKTKRDRKGTIKEITNRNQIQTENYRVSSILNRPIQHEMNQNKYTFPYVGEIPPPQNLWAIIRENKELRIKRSGERTWICLYQIKAVANSMDTLSLKLQDFIESDPYIQTPTIDKSVSYAVSEIRIKTSFDIDNKTQHRAFFVFGKVDFDSAINDKGGKEIKPNQLEQLRALLKQRKANAEKLGKDQENINSRLSKKMPDDLEHGMLAFYQKKEGYFSLTAVPQKPYTHSPRDLIEKAGKLACKELESLCPACHMFGTSNLQGNDPKKPREKITAIKGKISVSNGTLCGALPKNLEPVTLKALGTPKPTYYPFYILDNRGTPGSTKEFKNYDENGIRIGRKVYLHHHVKLLDYKAHRKTNLNATIHPVPEGTKFKFQIHFTNLSHYELGLLIYSLNMRYEGEKTGYHIGMGKPLGLGSCRIKNLDVTIFDINKRYSRFLESGEKKLNDKEIAMLEKIYKYVQGTKDKILFKKRISEVNGIPRWQDVSLPSDETVCKDYFGHNYLSEYHFLKSINIHSKYKIDLDLPIIFVGGKDKGFEWYQKARKAHKDPLFNPLDLRENFQKQSEFALRCG